MISQGSRYASCILYKDGQEEFLGRRPKIDTSPRPDDQFHKIEPGDNIDRLADRYFSRPDLWWVIADYNDIFFPLQLKIGTMLRLPSQEKITMENIA